MLKKIGFILFLMLLSCNSNIVLAQVVTASPDSIPVNPATSAIPKEKEKTGMSKPNRAALYSAIIPGAGQFYNKDYWKVPVVYAVGGTLAYFIIYNNKNYHRFRKAYELRIDGDTNTVDEYAVLYPAPGGNNFLKNNRDYFRRNRDLSIILAVVAYGMNIIEANVGAHLNEFDISDDLSLKVKADVLYVAGNAAVPGLSLNLQFKK